MWTKTADWIGGRLVLTAAVFLFLQGTIQELKLTNEPSLASVQCEDILPVNMRTLFMFFTVCWNRVTTTPTRDLISLDGAFRGRRRKETDDNPIGVPRCCFLVRPITARPILHHFSLLHLFPFARHLAICK